MTFDDFRRRIGSILGVAIPKQGFESVARQADSRGGFTNRQMLLFLIALYEYLESQDEIGHESAHLPQNETL